jgi:hypothetical protein
MAGIVRNVDVWPPSGWYDEPWQSNPDADAFCKSAVSVTAAYSLGLPALALPAWRSWVRFACFRSPDDRVHVRASVGRDPSEMEFGYIGLPAGVAEWAPEDRARLVLEAVHAGMVRLGEARGWDPSPLERLREITRELGLERQNVGDWKSSPDRRHRARIIDRTAPDGQGRLGVEVADRDGVVVAATEEVPGWPDAKRRPLKWHGSDRVGVVTIPEVGRMRVASLFVEHVDGEWRTTAIDPNVGRLPTAGEGAPVGRLLPEIVVSGVGVEAPEEPPTIRVVGGGPMNGVSAVYMDALTLHLERFADPSGQVWWQAAGVKELQVMYRFGLEPAIWSRRTGQRLRAEIRRPPETTHQASEALAVDDVRALVAEVRRKTGLGPHPSVPE